VNRALALTLVCVALFGSGYIVGGTHAKNRYEARAIAAQRVAYANAERLSRIEAERLALQAERDALSLELEDAARADPDADRPALSADSVRRLNSR